jgi:2-oxoglutarate ferredoxin oxidoreductase subunit delta
MAKQKQTKYPVMDENMCKKCNICVAFCPKKVFDARAGATPRIVRPEDCIGCELCVLRCPDFALSLEGGEKKSE